MVPSVTLRCGLVVVGAAVGSPACCWAQQSGCIGQSAWSAPAEGRGGQQSVQCVHAARINHQAHGRTVAACDVAADPGAAWIQSELAGWLQAMRPHALAESLTSPTLSGTCPAFLVRLPAAVGSCGAAALPALGCAVHESGQLCGLCCSALCRHASPCKRHCHRGCMAVPKMCTAPHQVTSQVSSVTPLKRPQQPQHIWCRTLGCTCPKASAQQALLGQPCL